MTAAGDDTTKNGRSHKRAFKACLHCRSKKAKCEFEGLDFNPPCLRCRREGVECIFVPTRRGRRSTGHHSDVIQLDRSMSPTSGLPDKLSAESDVTADAEMIAGADLRNPSDAIEIMALSSGNKANLEGAHNPDKSSSSSEPWSKIAAFPLIKSGIISIKELRIYLKLYFDRHHYYMPLISKKNIPQTDLELSEFIAKESFLASAMITVASRYQSLAAHKACWKFVKSEISNVFFGANSGVGIVEGLLLLSDNIPLIDGADDYSIQKYETQTSWNLVGLAIRLSYFLGLDQKTFLPPSDTMGEETYRQRLAWTYCYIFDRQVSVQLGKAFWSRGPGLCFQNQPGFGLPLHVSSMLNFPTLNSDYAAYIEAMIEITQILTNVHDTLYPNRDRTIALAEIGDYCRYLDQFIRTFAEFEVCWEPQKWNIFPLKEIVWISFHYSALYAYSLGFQSHVQRAVAIIKRTGKTDDSRPLSSIIFPRGVTGSADSKYILESIKSANQIITIFVNEICEAGLLVYLPQRFSSYVSYAAVFLIKAVFTGAILEEDQASVLSLLERLIRFMENVGAGMSGFLHPCTRLAKQLRSMIHSLVVFKNSTIIPFVSNERDDVSAKKYEETLNELALLLGTGLNDPFWFDKDSNFDFTADWVDQS